MHALPLLLLLAAPAEPSAARRLAEVCRIYAEEAALPAHLKANLSEMKTVRDSLRDLDVEVTSHKQEVESSLTGCNGPFADDAAKAAHLAVCEPRQKALGEKGAALAARATALDARIAKCTAEAKRLSDAHKAAPPRIAELQTSLKGSGELAGTCSGEAEGRALHACWLDVWEKLQRPSPAAVTLIEAFDEVARTFTRAGREGVGLRKGPIVRSAVETNNCQDFFRAMAALRKEQGLETWADEFDDMDASAIARELSRVSKAGGGRWRSLGGYDPGV